MMSKPDTPAKAAERPAFMPKRSSYTTARGVFSVCSWEPATGSATRKDARPILHFAHATGFNGCTYGPLLARISGDFQVRAWDARGHGQTPAPLDIKTHANWEEHKADLLALIEHWAHESGQRVYLAGHSMGATISCMLAAEHPELVSALLLLDPVIVSSAHHPLLYRVRALLGQPASPLSRTAAKRRAVFPDVGTMFEAYQKRGAFRTWEEAFLHAYVSGGVRKHAEGVELACAPNYEAALFDAAADTALAATTQLSIPFSVLMAEQDSTTRVPKNFFRSAGPNRIRVVPHSTHFLPMEQPDIVTEEIFALRKRAALFGSDGEIGETKLLELRTRLGVHR